MAELNEHRFVARRGKGSLNLMTTLSATIPSYDGGEWMVLGSSSHPSISVVTWSQSECLATGFHWQQLQCPAQTKGKSPGADALVNYAPSPIWQQALMQPGSARTMHSLPWQQPPPALPCSCHTLHHIFPGCDSLNNLQSLLNNGKGECWDCHH